MAAKLKFTDREILRMILAAQKELAEILYKMNINQNSRDAAAELHTNLGNALAHIPK